MNSASYNTSCNGEMRWGGDGDGAAVADEDFDLDDARDDGDDDGDDLPFREVISPAESARRRWLFFSVGFCHEAAAKLLNSPIFRVFTPGGNIGQRGHQGGPPGIQEGTWRAQGGPRQGPFWSPDGSPQVHLWSPSVNPQNNVPCKISSNLELI